MALEALGEKVAARRGWSEASHETARYTFASVVLRHAIFGNQARNSSGFHRRLRITADSLISAIHISKGMLIQYPVSIQRWNLSGRRLTCD